MGRRDVVELIIIIIIIIKRTVLVFEMCRNSSSGKLNAREKSLRSRFSSGGERVSKRDFEHPRSSFPNKSTKRILLFRVCEFFSLPAKKKKNIYGGKTNKQTRHITK